MKKNSKWLALLLAGAMTVSPLSYVNAYAAEGDGAVYSTDATAEVQTENTETNAVVTDAPAVDVSANEASVPETTGETNKIPASEDNKNSVTDTNAESEPESSAKQKDSEDESEASQKESTEQNKSEDKDSENQNQPETEIKETETVEETQADTQEETAETENEIATQAAETPVKPTAAINAFKVVKNDGISEYRMFPIENVEYAVKGNQLEISFNTGAKTTYNWLYPGLYTDENKANVFKGTDAGSTRVFTIQVPLSERNSWIPISVRKTETDEWYANYLWMSIPNVAVITNQPADITCKVNENAKFTVNTDIAVVSYQWQFSTDGSTWTDCTGDSAKSANYEFTMAETLVGQYRCVITDQTGAKTISDVALAKLDQTVINEKEDWVANNGISSIYASDDVNKPGQDYTMLRIAKSQILVKGNKLQVTIWVNPNGTTFTYDAIYIGNRNDDAREPVVLGEVDTTLNLEKFIFTVPVENAGGEVHFVPRNRKSQKWSTSSSLALKLPALDKFKAPSQISINKQPESKITVANGESVVLSVEASEKHGATLSYQWQFSTDGTTWEKCEGETATQPTYTFTMTEQTAGQYRCVVSDGEDASVESTISEVALSTAPSVTGSKVQVVKEDGANFKMFIIKESSIIKTGDELEVTMSTTNSSFSGIYLGSKDDAAKTPVITGNNADGKWTFTFKVPVSYAGQVIPVTLQKTDGTWYVNQYLWMYIPSEGIKDIPTITDEIKTIAGGTGAVYNDFAIASSKAVLSGSNIILTLNVKGNKWTKLYQGVQADKNKTKYVTGSYDATADQTTFILTVSSDKQGMNIAVTPGNDSAWFTYARDLFINVPKFKEIPNTTADGTYDLYGQAYPTNNYISLNFERESSVTIHGDTATVIWVTQAKDYDKIYIGSKDDADSVKDAHAIVGQSRDDIASGYKSFTFTIPTSELGKELNYIAHSGKTDKWMSANQSKCYIHGILAASTNTDPTPTPDPDPTPKPDPDPTPKPDPTPGTNAPADAIYSVEVESSASMFRVVDCQLTVKNGKMTAILTLSGTGYGYLYVGTSAQAAVADKSTWVPFKENAEGKYTYEIPVESLDQKISVAAYSTKNQKWYDRELTFKSDTLKKIGDVDSGSGENPNPTPGTPSDDKKPGTDSSDGKDNGSSETPSGNDGKADNESKYESDTKGSTSRVDSSTGLKDGVYTPDRFTWSGGTGKVRISCNKVTIQNGQAYATLVFSSNHYQYVKANGNTYYTTKSGNTASVVIPIALNKNNKIIGMTDKMSAAHEIEYSIFVYLAAANTASDGNGSENGQAVDNKALAEKAPEIMGLEYESETKLEYAEYFKIYHYDQGIVLLEVDMTKDTARDPENEKTSEDDKQDAATDSTKASDEKNKTSDESKQAVTDEELDAQDNNGVSEEELAAELYKGNVVNYLLVPEGVEIPVGLEQDMIIVNLPADKTYAASEDILETMQDLDLLDNVAAIGMKKEACDISEITDKMAENAEADTQDAEVVFGGTFEQPDLKTLVKQEVNLALLPAKFLPADKDENTSEDTDKENTTAESEVAEDETTESDASVAESEDPEGELSVEEQEELFEKVTEKFAMLGIPVIVDRSSQEKTELAKLEWIKVYGILYGCEDQVNEKFETAVKAAEK